MIEHDERLQLPSRTEIKLRSEIYLVLPPDDRNCKQEEEEKIKRGRLLVCCVVVRSSFLSSPPSLSPGFEISILRFIGRPDGRRDLIRRVTVEELDRRSEFIEGYVASAVDRAIPRSALNEER